MNEIKIIKDSLRIIESKYVCSKKIDDNSYKITFTYKNRNYIMNLNIEYKFIMLTISESIYGMDINNDTQELMDSIRQMIVFTRFEGFNVFTVASREEIKNGENHKVLQITQEKDNRDLVIDIETIEEEKNNYESKMIEYNFGLNILDKRLFNEDIFEDFDEKVSTLCEEDLFLMYTTLVSYFYKLIDNLWEDEKIDPYIIDDMINILYKEIQNRLKDKTYYEWFTEWNNYFTDENIENYLNNRNKEKSLS